MATRARVPAPPPPPSEDAANTALTTLKNSLAGSTDDDLNRAISSSSSLAQLIRQLRLISDADIRLQAQTRLLDAAKNFTTTLNDQLVDLMQWVEEDLLLARSLKAVQAIVDDAYGGVKKAAEHGKTVRNNKRGYMAKINTN